MRLLRVAANAVFRPSEVVSEATPSGTHRYYISDTNAHMRWPDVLQELRQRTNAKNILKESTQFVRHFFDKLVVYWDKYFVQINRGQFWHVIGQREWW